MNPIKLTEIDREVIEEFTNQAFGAKDSKVVKLDTEYDEITVECTTDGWGDGFSMHDRVIYRCPNGYDDAIDTEFLIPNDIRIDYYKLLLEHNVNPILNLL